MQIKVRVTAGARKESLKELVPNNFEISVREEATGNMANKRVRELLALRYGMPLKQVRIVRGQRSPSKILSIPSA